MMHTVECLLRIARTSKITVESQKSIHSSKALGRYYMVMYNTFPHSDRTRKTCDHFTNSKTINQSINQSINHGPPAGATDAS